MNCWHPPAASSWPGWIQTTSPRPSGWRCKSPASTPSPRSCASAGLRRLGIEGNAPEGLGILPIDPDSMVPSAGQGIVGVTVREDESELRELLSGIEDPQARAVSTAERALLALLDGSCRTPIGGYARFLPDGQLHLIGLVARADGSFLLKRSIHGLPQDAARMGAELGRGLRADSPSDLFA